MMMMMGGRNNNSRFPFTASQWQELEHQALIFKYMASGHPIPSDLILSMRRSIMLDSSPLYAHHPNMGWGCYQMGFGRKAEDPEPGRCRRTDGKKWRCSKEAHPDSKYCERHMHRGKNRSRKPVETNLSTTSTTTAIPTSTNVCITTNTATTNQTNSSSLYPTPNHLLSDAHNSYFNLDSAASSNGDYRYYHGMREEVNQFSGFQGGATAQDGSWRFTPLGMSSLGEPRQRSFCYDQGGGGEEKQNHCFVLGADFKVQRPVEREEAEKPLRRFFDEWPLKNKEESWIDVEHDRSSWSSSVSKTQLSISTPMAHHEFISQSHTDD